MLSTQKLSKIGIGTWGIGGFMQKNPDNDDAKQIDAIKYSLDKGINYIDTATMYGGGYSLELVRKALVGLDRTKLFINSKLTGEIKTKEDISNMTDYYLKSLNVDYLDSIQLHAPWRSLIPLEQTFEEMAKMISAKKARFISVSNCLPEQLDLCRKVTNLPLFSHEVDYNFEVRLQDDIGVVKNCLENQTKIICYQPLRRNETAKQKYPLLLNLSEKYSKSQNQITLNWLTHKPFFFPITKSSTKEHIDENIGSLNFDMDQKDYESMENFRIDFKFPEPDLHLTGNGVRISNFSLYLTEKLVEPKS